MISKKFLIKIVLMFVIIYIAFNLIIAKQSTTYAATLSVRNNREPRIVSNKKNKDYLFITLHDSSGIKTSKTTITLGGQNCKLELIGVSDGIYASDGRRIKDIQRNGGSYSGKKYDYGVKINKSDLSASEFKNIYVYSFDYGNSCFIKETFKVKKLEKANSNGEYYSVNRAPRLSVHAINNRVKVDAIDYSGIKSIKILSKKSGETVYSFLAGKAQANSNSKKGVIKNGYYYPYTVIENIDMNLIEKAQKDEPGRYRFRIFVEDSSGMKSEKTMTSHVSGANSNKNTTTNKSTNTSNSTNTNTKTNTSTKTNTTTSKNTSTNTGTSTSTGNKLNKKAGFFKEKYGGMKYYLSVPDNPTENMPFIIFLHGDGEEDKFSKLGGLPIVSYVKSKKAYKAGKFIFIAPLRTTSHWASGSDYKKVMKLIDKIANDYKVDKNRIILTGMSSGGNGTWNIAWKHPKKFAAILVMSGKTYGAESHAKELANMPVYGICGNAHGEERKRNEMMKKMIRKIKQVGKGKYARLETISGATHGGIQKYYQRQSVFKWMLSQKKN